MTSIVLHSFLFLSMLMSAGDAPLTHKITYIDIYSPIESRSQVKAFASAIKRARRGKLTSILVLRIDSPGGDPKIVSEMLRLLKNANVRTVAWIDNARYGGVFGMACALPLMCDSVYMHEGSRLGTVPSRAPFNKEMCKENNYPIVLACDETMDIWRNGIAVNERLLSDIRMELGDALPMEQLPLLCIGLTLCPSMDTKVGIKKQVLGLGSKLSLTAVDAMDAGLLSGIANGWPAARQKAFSSYSSKEVVTQSPSNLVVIIKKIRKNLDKFGKARPRFRTFRHHGNITKRMRALRRQRSAVRAITASLKINPMLQHYLYADLKQQFGSNGKRFASDDWYLYKLDALAIAIDEEIDGLKMQRTISW